MEKVHILANFWGWFLIISCLIYLVKRKALEEVFQLAENKIFLLVSGYLALVLGLISLTLYNLLTGDWRIVIVILGWISLIKGIMAIAFPEITQKVVEKFKNNLLLTRIWLVIVILLGIWLVLVS